MTALRQQEQEKFQETEKELVQSIGALESAITVLSKHNSFMQTGSTDFHEVASVLSSQLSKYQSRHMGEITPSQRNSLEQFIQQPSYGAYQSQSGEIFGILGNMKDEFTSDLAEERKMEADAVDTYAKGKKIKEETIKAQETAYKTQSTKAADSKAAAAEAEAAKSAAEESLAKATALLDEATASCATSASDYEARVKVRAEEMAAVAKALEFLNSDEAHALFNKTFNFLQIAAGNNARAHQLMKAQATLKQAGFDFRKKDMFVLAQAIKAGAFDKVIKAIDDLVKEIDATIASDAQKKDEYTQLIFDKKSKLAALNNKIEKEEAKKASLESKKAALEESIAKLEEEIAATQKDQKELSQAREQQNKEYQTAVADQNASIQVLN
jgi:hypothetical protein